MCRAIYFYAYGVWDVLSDTRVALACMPDSIREVRLFLSGERDENELPLGGYSLPDRARKLVGRVSERRHWQRAGIKRPPSIHDHWNWNDESRRELREIRQKHGKHATLRD